MVKNEGSASMAQRWVQLPYIFHPPALPTPLQACNESAVDEHFSEGTLNDATRFDHTSDTPRISVGRPIDKHGCDCTSVDYHSAFDKGGPEIKLCSLEHAMKCQDCYLCKFIAELAETAAKVSEWVFCGSKHYFICRLKRSAASQDEFPQRMSTNLYTRLLLVIRNENPEFDTQYALEGLGTSFTLDRVGFGPSDQADSTLSTIYRRPVQPVFNPTLLRGWLAESDRNERSRGKLQPFQQVASFDHVLATGMFKVADVVRDTIVTVTEPIRYLALSYVWGQSMTHYAAATKNWMDVDRTDPRSVVIDWHKAPRTLYDAAKLTRAIGERYLWIDSLCIDQSNAEEKGLVISQMASIYANSYLTIVAADGTGADAGLTRLRSNPAAAEVPISVLGNSSPISLLRRQPDNRQAIIRSHWSSRGWTLQERLISKRCVFFTDEQVYFQDAEVQVSEAYGICRPSGVTALRKHAHNNENSDVVGDLYFRIIERKGLGLAQYDQAVKEYTKRTLSHPGDRLDAFIGISEFFQPPGLPEDHIAALSALPFRYFTNALRWSHSVWKKPAKRIRLDARNSRYLPSWSWVGWDGEVSGPFGFDPFANPARILDSANILCNICNEPSDFSPSLCEPTHPKQVTLHLLATSIPCHLGFHGSSYEVLFESIGDSNCPAKLKNRIEMDDIVEDSWSFELVLMSRVKSEGHNQFWLMRVDQPFAERVAFVNGEWKDGELYPHLKEKYYKVR